MLRRLLESIQNVVPNQYPPVAHGQEIVRYIDQHFTEPVTVRSLARVLGWDSKLIAGIFHREVGLTVHAYLSHKRTAEAAAKLRRGDKVESVLADSGWRSRKNFFRAFKKRYGTTPAKYRAARGRTGEE